MNASHDPADKTARVELPVEETGPVPVSIAHAEPRWFGIPPPLALLGLACASLVGAIVLFALGPWPYGLLLVGVGALLLAAFLEVARRRPETAVTRVSGRAAAGAREWTVSAFEQLRAHSAAAAELQRVRSARAVLEAERRAVLLQLGDAIHREDESAASIARARLQELDVVDAELRERAERRVAETHARIRSARLSVQQTMVVRPGDEGQPPTPPPVPEPYPPPDEGTPPTPAPVPEPSPDPPPEPEPEHGSRRPAA